MLRFIVYLVTLDAANIRDANVWRGIEMSLSRCCDIWGAYIEIRCDLTLGRYIEMLEIGMLRCGRGTFKVR